MKRIRISPEAVLAVITLVSIAELVFLPQQIAFLPDRRGNALLYFSKYPGLLCSYALAMAGIFLWDRPERKRFLRRIGAGLTTVGCLLTVLYLFGNSLSLHMEGAGVLLMLLWPLVHGGIQLWLCLCAKKQVLKGIPIVVVLAEALFPLWIWTDPLRQNSGWDELAALILGIFVLWAAGAVLLAWLIYGFVRYLRKKKQNISPEGGNHHV